MEPEKPRESEVHVEPGAVGAPQQGPRCSYCHETLEQGELASDCQECHTLQHMLCFGENLGCSTMGCGSHRAKSVRVGAEPEGTKATLSPCAHCKVALSPKGLVARCGCNRVLHPACYDQVGCTLDKCERSMELMSYSDAAAARKRLQAKGTSLIALGTGASGLVGILLLLLGNPSTLPGPLVLLGFLGPVLLTIAVFLSVIGLFRFFDANALEEEPPPRLGGPPELAAELGEAPKAKAKIQIKKELA